MASYLAIGIMSGATLLLELALLRLFAVQQFYHFAFMAISLALLGAGASGSILSVRGRRFPPAWLCLLFGVTTLAAYSIINYSPFDSFSIAWDRRQILHLAVYFLAATVPFLFSGLLVGGELMRAGKAGTAASHRVYGSNLIGSALGSVLSLPFLSLVGGEGAVLIAVAAGGAAGFLFTGFSSKRVTQEDMLPTQVESRATAGGERSAKMVGLIAPVILMAGAALALLLRPDFMKQRLSPYKTLSLLSQVADFKHVLSSWDATARLDAVESDAIHIMPGLSLLSPVGPPTQAGLLLDGDNLMPILGLSPDSDEASLLADYLPEGIGFLLRPRGRTLVVEAGAGMSVLFALASGAEHVTAVEDNRLVIEALRDGYRDFSHGLYSDDRVTVINQSGRIYVRQPGNKRFDLLFIALTDPHRPVTSGAYSLTENYVYTVDAMRDYLNVLDEHGWLLMTRWLQTPPSESARAFGMIAAALAESGRDPAAHLAAFRSLRTMTILASMEPITAAEVEIVRTFLTQRGFDAVYFPGIRLDELNRFNILPEPVYSQLFGRILADAHGTYADYRYDIRPPTDDHPFFFHYFRWRQTPEIMATLGMSWQPFGGSGFFVLVALLLLVGLASVLLIAGPLMVQRFWATGNRGAAPGWRLRVIIYFGALGLAFLFVEIPLAQRFILVLEQPVTALAFVLFSLLLFSGFGSWSVSRWRLRPALIALVLLIAIYPLILEPVSTLALRMPDWIRIGMTVLALSPLGFLMGVPFAAGLRLVERREPSLVPWAWAINGSFSVISAVLAVMVALSWGFSAVLWLGAAAYAAAFFAFAPFELS